MTGWIGVDDPARARFLHPAAERDRTKRGRSFAGCLQVRNGQIEMELLGRSVRPNRRGVGRRQLKGQLQSRAAESHLTPLGIVEVGLAVEKIRVEGRQRRGVRAVEDDRPQADVG